MRTSGEVFRVSVVKSWTLNCGYLFRTRSIILALIERVATDWTAVSSSISGSMVSTRGDETPLPLDPDAALSSSSFAAASIASSNGRIGNSVIGFGAGA